MVEHEQTLPTPWHRVHTKRICPDNVWLELAFAREIATLVIMGFHKVVQQTSGDGQDMDYIQLVSIWVVNCQT